MKRLSAHGGFVLACSIGSREAAVKSQTPTYTLPNCRVNPPIRRLAAGQGGGGLEGQGKP
jgi:hypothetical protein